MTSAEHSTATLPGLLARRAADRPDGVALREKEFGIWQEVTWAEYLSRVRSFCLGMMELGIEKGDRIAIVGDNRPEWVIAELAAQAMGALPLGLYQDSISTELAKMLEVAEARVIVAEDQEQVDKVLEVRDGLPGLEHIVYYDPRGMYGYEAPGLMAFEEVEALGDRFRDRFPGEFVNKARRGPHRGHRAPVHHVRDDIGSEAGDAVAREPPVHGGAAPTSWTRWRAATSSCPFCPSRGSASRWSGWRARCSRASPSTSRKRRPRCARTCARSVPQC